MNDDMLKAAAKPTVPNSRLTCAQCERMVLDAIDGALLPDDRAQFDLHLAGCPDCSRAMEEAQAGEAWLGMLREAPPQPPSLLLERILAQTSGDPSVAIVPRQESILAASTPGFAPRGRVIPFESAPGNRWKRMLQSIGQPRFAMTAAMAFFSIALTLNLTGVRLNELSASSIKPSSLRHTFWSANAKVIRYYDNLRVVYELESRVRELQRQSDDQDHNRAAPSGTGSKSAPDKSGGRTGGQSSLPEHSAKPSRQVDTDPEFVATLPSGRNNVSATRRGEGVRA